MSITRSLKTAGMATALGLLAASCAERTSAPEPYQIRFAAMVGEEPFACGQTYENIGVADATIKPQSLMAYVSNVALIRKDGREEPLTLTPDGLWQSESVALLDFEDATGGCNGTEAMNTVIRGAAPKAEYRGVRFTLGVPETLNHEDATLAEAPLNYTGLFWGWRYGYIFFRLDLDTSRPGGPAPQNAASGFSAHLGSVGCGAVEQYTLPPETPCTAPNRKVIELAGFDPLADEIIIDLEALLRDADVTVNTPDTASGCMSGLDDPECMGLLSKFGFSAYGEGDQQVFSVRQ